MTEKLRNAFRKALEHRSCYSIAEESGLSQIHLSRFLRGDRKDMLLATAVKLAMAIGYELKLERKQ